MPTPRSPFLRTASIAAAVVVALVLGQMLRPEPIAGHVRIVDENGDPTPAMISLRRLDTGEVFLPDGRPAIPTEDTTFYEGLGFSGSPSWVGPVRKIRGRGDNRDRSLLYGEQPSIPWWPESSIYQAGPEIPLSLPTGDYRLAVSRGPEYAPSFRDIAIRPGAPLELEIALERWVHMADDGWYAGDVHVHHPTQTPEQRAFLLHQARAADLPVVHALQLTATAGDFLQALEDLPLCEDGYCLVGGQEDQRTTEGHTLGLNIDAAATALDQAALGEALHAQGSLFGFAHFPLQGPVPSAFTTLAPLELLDFVESLQFAQDSEEPWMAYLDLGFRLTVAAGSDVPWGSTMGEVRTYVHLDGPLTVDAWMEGLERGHTFVTNGPMLAFEVDGALPGSELERSAGDVLTVRARAWAHPAIGSPTELQLLGTGGVVLAERTGAGPLELELQVEVDHSQWLTVTTRADNGATAHATPIYVVVDGQPTWSTTRGPQLVAQRLADLDRLQQTLGDAPVQRALSDRIDAARALYQALAIPQP